MEDICAPVLLFANLLTLLAKMVACSCEESDGCLSLIRNGISFIEHASFEQTGVQAIWALKVSSDFVAKSRRLTHYFRAGVPVGRVRLVPRVRFRGRHARHAHWRRDP